MGYRSKGLMGATIRADTISEVTSGNGVAVDGVTLKDGNVVPDSGKGVDFSATADANAGVTSELLDDYEEGEYTATITCATSGSYNIAASTDTLMYTKIGRVVYVQGLLSISSESSPVGRLRLSLPTTIAAGTESSEATVAFFFLEGHGDAGIENPYLNFDGGEAFASFTNVTDAGGNEALDQDRFDTAFVMRVNFNYVSA